MNKLDDRDPGFTYKGVWSLQGNPTAEFDGTTTATYLAGSTAFLAFSGIVITIFNEYAVKFTECKYTSRNTNYCGWYHCTQWNWGHTIQLLQHRRWAADYLHGSSTTGRTIHADILPVQHSFNLSKPYTDY